MGTASGVMHRLLESGSRIRALASVLFCVLWQDRPILSVPLSAQGYKWVPENAGATWQNAGEQSYIPSRGRGGWVNTPCFFMPHKLELSTVNYELYYHPSDVLCPNSHSSDHYRFPRSRSAFKTDSSSWPDFKIYIWLHDRFKNGMHLCLITGHGLKVINKVRAMAMPWRRIPTRTRGWPLSSFPYIVSCFSKVRL